MKICPTCNEEFENDIEVCPNDETPLEAIADEEAEPEAEAVEASAETPSEETSEGAEDVAAEAADDAPEEDAEEQEDAEPVEETTVAGAPAASEGFSTLQKAFVIVLVILLLSAGLVFWKSRVKGHGEVDLTSMTEPEMQTLLKDFNPMQLKQLAQNPDQKQKLIENISQLLALASEAKKEGVADEPLVQAEIENMRITLLAMAYDKKINSDKGPMPPFGFISEDQVKEFWAEDGNAKPETANSNTNAAPAANAAANSNTAANKETKPEPAKTPRKYKGFLANALSYVGLGWVVGDADARRHEAEFKMFLDNQVALLRERGQFHAKQEPTEEQIKQARDQFARTRIYYEEAMDKLNSIGSMPEAERKEWEDFEKSYELQAKLQEAQLLVQTFVTEKLKKKLEVSEKEVKDYVAAHPELTNIEAKKKKAEEVLKKVKEGGDFAELAKEYSDDPGSKNNGGLYENIAKGTMAPEFEAAALALEPGQVTDELVKTDYGFHIIKLVRKGEKKGPDGKVEETYDARHILISTLVKNPDDPTGRDVPVDQFVRQKLEKEKQEKVLDEIKNSNPISIPKDFKVPEPSAEELQKIQQQQQEQLRQMIEQQKAASDKNGEAPADKGQKKK